MFKCKITGRMSRPGEKVNKIVVETRPQTYFDWFLNEETGRMEQHEVARGWEIVREVNATDEGLRIWRETEDATK